MKVAKVGLVCCPNCDYLLPHDLSLEHCGNCGAVFPGDQGPVTSSSMTESDNNNVSWNMGKNRISSVRTRNMVSRSPSIGETREFLADYGSWRGDAIGPNSSLSSRSDNRDHNIGTRQSRVSPDYDLVPSTHSSGNDTTDIANKLEEIRRRFEYLGSQQGAEGTRPMTSSENIASATGRQNVASFTNHDVGTSNYSLGSSYGYIEHLKDVNGLSKVEGVENDRAELLGKLNELKDRLNRSYNAGEYPMEKVRPTHDIYGAREPSMSESSSSSYNYNMECPSRDKHDPTTLHSDQYLESLHYGQSYDVGVQDLHATRHVLYENSQHKDSYLPRMFKTPQYQSTGQYLPQKYLDHFNGKYTDFDKDPLISVPHETVFHQHGCRCSLCYSNNWKVNQEVPSSYEDYYQHGRSVIDDAANSSLVNLAPSPLYPQELHTRKLRDHSLENDVNIQHQKRRLITSLDGKRIVRPIAGSAPFIICPKCFQLLKLPRKLMLVENKQQTICCGACSTILPLKFGRNGLVILVQEQFNQGSERDDCSAERFSENIGVSSSSFDAGITNSGSKDYDDSGYKYQLTDTDYSFVQEENSDSALMKQEPCLSSSSFSEDIHRQDSPAVQRDVLKSVEPPSKDNGPLPLQGVALQEHHDKNLKTASAKDGKGNKKTKRSYVGKLIHSLVSRNDSVKDVSLATETDVSSEAYMNSGVTQDSIVEEIIEEEQPKINKRSESVSARHREDRFAKFSNSNQSLEDDEDSEVYVNGQFIPPNAVKKAEKVAGTIEPGDYWYDFQAGFWGVMGHPCLGIIAPYIKAFNYPMPECCAAGNTEVYVNGRELNQGDLDKLSSRGLPTTKHKSYIIKINGKVLDADTHEVLHNLGKLAPTVQRARRGFGMKIPKSLQQYQDD